MSRSRRYFYRRRGPRDQNHYWIRPDQPVEDYALAYHEYWDTPDGDYTTFEARVGALIDAALSRHSRTRKKVMTRMRIRDRWEHGVIMRALFRV